MATTRIINNEAFGMTAITFNPAGVLFGQMTFGDLHTIILRHEELPAVILALTEALEEVVSYDMQTPAEGEQK